MLPVCLVAGNKCDLQSMRQVGAREGLEWARTRGFGFMETSAREMVNIEETFACTWWVMLEWQYLANHNYSTGKTSRCRSQTTPRRHQAKPTFLHGQNTAFGTDCFPKRKGNTSFTSMG